MYRYDEVMREIMGDRNLRKQYEAAKTEEEKMEIICETAFQLGWSEADYSAQMSQMIYPGSD
jgi:hypothetical protein